MAARLVESADRGREEITNPGTSPRDERASVARIISGATVATVLTVLPIFMVGAFVVLIREDIAITDEQLGLIVAAFFLVSTISSVPGGRLADAIGPRAGMALGAVMSLLALTGIGSVATQWWHVAALMLVGGLGNGIGMPSSNLALAQQIPLDRRGFAFGVKQASAPMASVFVGLAVPLLGLTIGWRWSLNVSAIALAVAFVALNGGDTIEGRDIARRATGTTAPLAAMVLLALTATFASGAATSMIGFFVESAVEGGFATGTAGYVVGVGSAFGIAARVGWGVMADRREKGHLAFLSWLFAVGSIGFVLVGVANTVPLLALGAIIVFVAGWSWSGLMFLVATLGSPGSPATATGITSAGGGLGGILGPIAFGAILGHASYTVAWLVAASWMVLAALLARLTLRTWLRLNAIRAED